MQVDRPEAAEVLRAVDAYLRVAYGGEPLPAHVRSQLAVLQTWKGDFFRSPAIASDGGTPPKRYSIRLGNRHYPHMKLAVERSPDGRAYLFKADTHDAHCLPPADRPEYAAFREMMERNRVIAAEVEQAWAAEGLMTFKAYLQADLARRQGAQQDPPA
jgi:hypothetical protein